MKNKKVYAKDFKCCKCGKQAVCFWPTTDPDIPEKPYCKDCVSEAKYRLFLEISKL